MSVRKAQPQPAPAPERDAPERENPYPGDTTCGGEIKLNTPARRAIFIAGLAGAVFIGFLLTLALIA
ncbi:MAG TPA: peptide ABC transporter permease [Methylocella sp.]|nr:peptide ABC transporter permease [Methylocella sp.]